MDIKKYRDKLIKCSLFEGFNKDEILTIANCFQFDIKKYGDNNFIWFAGDYIEKIGIVVSGEVLIVKDDVMGNRNIISQAFISDIFGESFVCAGNKKTPVSVIAKGDCEVIFISLDKLITQCSNSCAFHARLIQNMLKIIAQKNILINNKLFFISKKTLREKISSFLISEYEKNNGISEFKIQLDRNELASFLCADRSALSRELTKMKNDGLIEYKKNKFHILNIEKLCLLDN